MKKLVLLPILLAATAAQASEAWQLECPNLTNAQECAMRYEATVVETYPALFTREQGRLIVTLRSGATKVYKDPSARFNVVAVHEASHTAVVREQYSEGNGWQVLDLNSGVATEIGGFPVFAPDGLHFFAIEPVSEARYNDAVAAIFRKDTRGRVFAVWKSKCTRADWGPTSPIWHSGTSLSFGQVRLLPTGEREPMGRVHLRWKSGNWQAVGLWCRGDA